MPILIVVNNPANWPLQIPGVEIVSARTYLTEPRFSTMRGAKVLNVSRSYRYQSLGYYVSLLATARGHRPQPDVITIQDMKSPTIVRGVSEELDELIQRSFSPIQSNRFTLSIYFGRNLARCYDRLSLQLFNLFPAPLLRAHFSHSSERWHLQHIGPIAAGDIPDDHRAFVTDVATQYFARKRFKVPRRNVTRYDLAILTNPSESEPPSDEGALQRFLRAADELNLGAELITRDDFGRLAQFDGLFIRETTSVNHHTYRFARRATAEGLVVIDDPESIVRCGNKVYQAELAERLRIPTPRTLIVHRENVSSVCDQLGLPCVLKRPDGAFSEGILKVDSKEEFLEQAELMLERSELILAQEFLPTTFDWRVGVLDGVPLFVCRYYMAGKHWQIIRRSASGRKRYGKVETLASEAAPQRVLRMAIRAARAVGDGLYGVDLKQSEGKCYLLEVNDNPSIESGVEDVVLRDELYRRILRSFLRRIETRRKGAPTS